MSLHDTIAATVARHGEALKALARRIHANPELGLAEHQAVGWQVELLEAMGFEVTVPFGGLATAYRAQRGQGGPVVAFLAEYDALPGIGHGCGHNLIAPAAIGAGAALAEALAASGTPGTVAVIGTPGEEGKGGKVRLAEAGAFEGLDLALMAHPRVRTTADTGRLAVLRREVRFTGQAAHAANSPEMGRNALDGVLLLMAGVNAWRQHLPEPSRVHGIVTEGGDAPNVVPDHAACRFYLRADNDRTLAEMLARFEQIARGAALMSATEVEVSAGDDRPYSSGRINAALNRQWLADAEAMGLAPDPAARPGRGSSDFGNVSALLPGAHYYFQITDEPLASHSPQFAQAAATDRAQAAMLKTAEALARGAGRFCTDADFREQVRRDFTASA